jgi:hypothetical protein
MGSPSWRATAVLSSLLCLWGPSAYAYRPFNSTDAAGAARGEMEVECGPLGYVVDVDGRFFVVPSFILNFGIAEEWELVIGVGIFFSSTP